ncbi:MAG: hypothetical protein JEZ07_01140 [Phycisphaerae bacterium]|nr:hypothetical protein [Phycisphaerae bacterium]
MKKTLLIMAILAFCFAGIDVADAQYQNDRGDSYQNQPQFGGQGQGQGGQGRGGYGRGGQQGQGQQGGQGGMMGGRGGQMQGGQMQGGMGMGRGGFGRVSDEDLLTFLQKYEPEMAKNLVMLNQENPDAFKQKMQSLQRVYGRVIMQMERDPEAGKLALKKIRLTLEINAITEATDTVSSADKAKIEKNVGQIFDIVIQEEQQRIKSWREMASNFGNRGGQDRGGRGQGQARGGDADERTKRMEESFKDRAQQIEKWRKNKEIIVKQRVEQLVNKVEAFPW